MHCTYTIRNVTFPYSPCLDVSMNTYSISPGSGTGAAGQKKQSDPHVV